jgi:polysaccharide biosynthesis/export protein
VSKNYFRVLLFAAVLPLAACGSLPTSGPSAKTIRNSTQQPFRVVDVDASVARELSRRNVQGLFADLFASRAENVEVVSPGDVLEVSVWEAPPAVLFNATPSIGGAANSGATTFPQQMVSGEGQVYIPFAGKIDAAGKSLLAIEADIQAKLRGKANQPQVLVRLAVNNTAYATVVGEVVVSARVPLTPRGERLLDALATAGGTKQAVGKITLQLTRGVEVQSLPLDVVIRDPLQNIRLQPGDVVTALYQPLSFTALGAAGKSDEVDFEAKGISLAQALARINGVIDTRADAAGVFIFRFEPAATPHTLNAAAKPDGMVPVIYRVNLKDPNTFFVAQNFPMQNKDVLYVANAPAAELQKFINLLLSTVYPIEGAVSTAKGISP